MNKKALFGLFIYISPFIYLSIYLHIYLSFHLFIIYVYRVKLVEKEKDELEGPMKEAVGWLTLSNDKVKLENKNLQGQIKNLQFNVR